MDSRGRQDREEGIRNDQLSLGLIESLGQSIYVARVVESVQGSSYRAFALEPPQQRSGGKVAGTDRNASRVQRGNSRRRILAIERERGAEAVPEPTLKRPG